MTIFTNIVCQVVSPRRSDINQVRHILPPHREFRILKSATFKEVMSILSSAMGYDEIQLRLWPFSQRTNQTYRPTVLELDEPSKSVSSISVFLNQSGTAQLSRTTCPGASVKLLPSTLFKNQLKTHLYRLDCFDFIYLLYVIPCVHVYVLGK